MTYDHHAPYPQREDYLGSPFVSPKNRTASLALALLGFTLVAGLHRIYVGKVATGLLWLLTGGLLGMGTIYDVVLLATGAFTDKQGRRLLLW